MKFIQNDYENTKEILKHPDHYVAIPVTVDDTNVSANSEGKKILPAGTPVGGVNNSVLENEDEQVEKKNDDTAVTGEQGAAVDAEGILLSDVDVTHGPAGGAMLIHAFVDPSKFEETIVADAKDAMSSMIEFVE